MRKAPGQLPSASAWVHGSISNPRGKLLFPAPGNLCSTVFALQPFLIGVTGNQPTSEPPSTESLRPESTAKSWRGVTIFLLFSLAVTLTMFSPVLLGDRILAPVDIPANFFPKYRYVDPTADGIPANHHVVDLILGDISRNQMVYDAWRQGEMPWWDPYTDGGRPLAAEAHAVNISDPWKVLIFHLLPFEHAYNWIRIVPFVLSGVAAFCLLRHLGFSSGPASWGGLLYQFAGCNVMIFSGPTVQAGFAYYPWLWLLWDRGMNERKLSWFMGSSLLTALIFLSGNVQSHSYVFLFALAFVIGYGWRQSNRWRLLVGGVGLALGAGLCLAAPFVLSQIELFMLSMHENARATPLRMLTGVASVSAIFPWLFGTYRTLDFSKIFVQTGIGFWIYIGSAAMVIAVLGWCSRTPHNSSLRNIKRTALALLAVYFVVCSTPLLDVFYTRIAWLAVLGLLILFGLGWNALTENAFSRRWGWTIISATLLMAVVLNVGGFVLFPQFRSRIEARVLQEDQKKPDPAPALRRFQVANWPNETTVKNPETALAFAGLIALGLMLVRQTSSSQLWRHATLVLSTLPLLWYAHRYIPMQPAALWDKIRHGGPEQHRLMETLRPERLRLLETAPGKNEHAFPRGLAQLYGVHVLHGHTSLVLPHTGRVLVNGSVDPALYDFEYRSSRRGLEQGELLPRPGPPARFHWSSPLERKVSIISETLCTVTLDIAPGPTGDLIRTDTYYPGWRVVSPARQVSLNYEPPCFTRLHIPAEVTRVRLQYEPRWWRLGIGIAAVSAVLGAAFFIADAKRRRKRIGRAPTASFN
jgi:hypothetical protein